MPVNMARVETASRSILLDYSGLKVHKRPLDRVVGQAGYRPILLLLVAIFFVVMALLPVPGSLLDLVEEVNPPGYNMMAGTETIVDSVNYRNNPRAFEAGQSDAPAATQGMDSSERVARSAMIMVGILLGAAVLWGTEALPIGGTVIVVAVLMFVFHILPLNEIPDVFVNDAVFFIIGILAVAVGVSKTGLDKRIGLLLLSRIKSARAVAFIFFPVLAVLAGFLSAHALVAILIPVMMGVYKASCTAHGVKQDRVLAIFLLLGVCFTANVGGPASPAAGARNAIMVGYLADAGVPIGFGEWMKYGMPLVPVLALTVGAYMYIRCKPKLLVKDVNPSEAVRREAAKLPKFGGQEAIMAAILGGLMIAWITLADTFGCWQSAQVGQIRTREDYYYEELRGSSLRVLL